jgi:penicillin-binding protein 1B
MAGWMLLLGSFAGGFVVGGELVRLDRIVVSRFEGRRFRVPSRVLSAPTILYPGLDWKRIGLRDLLDRLGYQPDPARAKPELGRLEIGHRIWGKRSARVHLRGFDHPTRPERPRDILIRFDGSLVREIRELPEDRFLGAVLLEPEPIGSYYGPDRAQRDLVQLGDVPQHLVDAVLAVEDQRFASHHGVDFRRIVGAAIANVRAGGIREGGSTLTQQLAKNFFLTPDRTYRRKLEEAAMAVIIEVRYDKDEILEAYLNEIYLGQRGATAIHGVGEASRLYFGKPVRHLEMSESALLAAIIQSPNGTNPYRHPEKARNRRDLVLSLMLRQGRIDAAAARAAREAPVRLATPTQEVRGARYFLDALRRQLPEVYDSETLVAEGLRIYSTLDFRLQRAAVDALVGGIEELERQHPRLRREDPSRRLQGCLVALRPQTGEILALVGGRSYGVSQFDRCSQARRQAGSAFKPFVFAAALEPNPDPTITLATILDDSPLRVDLPTGSWQPANFDHQFHGRVSVRETMERSLNVATARLGQDVGIARVADTARRLGITSPLPRVPSLSLGVADVSPLEMARAYATIAGGGVRPEIRTFEDLVDSQGRTVARKDIGFGRVIDGGTMWLLTSLMEGVVERGTAYAVRRAGVQGPVAGKTGTSDDERDAWFVGFTPEMVVAVWVGFDEPQSLGLASSRVAVPIWARFVSEATGGSVRGSFARPPEVIELDIEPNTGALALSGCPVSRREFFLEGTEPRETCPIGAVRREFDLDKEAGKLRDSFMDWLDDVLR